MKVYIVVEYEPEHDEYPHVIKSVFHSRIEANAYVKEREQVRDVAEDDDAYAELCESFVTGKADDELWWEVEVYDVHGDPVIELLEQEP